MSEGKIVKEYSNGEVTVIWQPHLCIHSTLCFNGLPEVFQPNERPWVKIAAADSTRIVEQVRRCPSSALSYRTNREADAADTATASETMIELVKNGPLLIHGNVMVKDAAGNEMRRANVTAFCRCGGSQNKPFCDGSHSSTSFEG